MTKLLICRICSNRIPNKVFRAREMILDTKEYFEYSECSYCGCLQILEIPEGMSTYYSKQYFAANRQRSPNINAKSFFDSAVSKVNKICHRNMFPRYIRALLKETFVFDLMRSGKFNADTAILEVGCGSGWLLILLSELGFRNIVGLEPYSEERARANLNILNSAIFELNEESMFDIIIFNHSLEHIPEQVATLAKVSRILTKRGICQIRIPVKTEYIWNRYGAFWVQLDAPRHFFLHTMRSIQILAERAKLTITSVSFDSTAFQFWGSEQYIRNISLRAENSYEINPEKSIFKSATIREYSRLARQLNSKGEGDQATFYLTRKS